jgi:hypothetical protein
MTGLNESVSEGGKIMAITIIVMKLLNNGHWSTQVFNANGITRQRYELSKQLQTRRIDVALLSKTRLKTQERFSIRNYHIYRNDRHLGAKGGSAVSVKKGVPYSYVDLPTLISIEATGVRITVGNKELLLAAVYRSRSGIGLTQTSMSS